VRGMGVRGIPSEEDDRLMIALPKRGLAMTPAPEIIPPRCVACGSFQAIKVCSRCKTSLFCDTVCQRRIWPQHKLSCQPLESVLAEMEDLGEMSGVSGEHEDQAQQLAQSLADFFQRGGPKAQRARLEEISPRAEAKQDVGPEEKRPEWLRRQVHNQEQSTEPSPEPSPESESVSSAPPPKSSASEPGLVALSNGVLMPRVTLGTGGFLGLAGKEGRAAMLAALKMGYRAIDTSEMNRNLLDVAWACQKSEVPREELFIIAKIAPWNHGYERAKSAFAQQLASLHLQHVDLLLLQWPHVWEGPFADGLGHQSMAQVCQVAERATERLVARPGGVVRARQGEVDRR